jgi:hypothetical protein
MAMGFWHAFFMAAAPGLTVAVVATGIFGFPDELRPPRKLTPEDKERLEEEVRLVTRRPIAAGRSRSIG